MELRESEVFCFIDDNRIGIQEVDTVFYHGRREENIVHAEFKFHYAVFEFIRRKLTIGNDDFCFGNQ